MICSFSEFRKNSHFSADKILPGMVVTENNLFLTEYSQILNYLWLKKMKTEIIDETRKKLLTVE